jgi:hypothetical protein
MRLGRLFGLLDLTQGRTVMPQHRFNYLQGKGEGLLYTENGPIDMKDNVVNYLHAL